MLFIDLKEIFLYGEIKSCSNSLLDYLKCSGSVAFMLVCLGFGVDLIKSYEKVAKYLKKVTLSRYIKLSAVFVIVVAGYGLFRGKGFEENLICLLLSIITLVKVELVGELVLFLRSKIKVNV